MLQRRPPTSKSSVTRRRKIPALLASLSTFISIIFTILVLLGSTDDSSPVLSSIYFLRIDVSNIIPRSFPNAVLVNSIAQTLGLRDFYQVGLWNYCEGYKDTGVTYCEPPQALYSFNPVKILLSQLLAGAESESTPHRACCVCSGGEGLRKMGRRGGGGGSGIGLLMGGVRGSCGPGRRW